MDSFLNLKCQNAVSTIFEAVTPDTRIPEVERQLEDLEATYGAGEVKRCMIAQLGCAELSLRHYRERAKKESGQ